jgi:hypothetical protein
MVGVYEAALDPVRKREIREKGQKYSRAPVARRDLKRARPRGCRACLATPHYSRAAEA